MTHYAQIALIAGTVNAVEALDTVADVTGEKNLTIESDVIYPYYAYQSTCLVKTLVGQKELSLVCLVDAVNGLGVTADKYEVQKETCVPEKLLDVSIDDVTATGVARQTVIHRLGKQLKTIDRFDVNCELKGIIYKRFWIVRAGESRFLVDSATAGWYPLQMRAA